MKKLTLNAAQFPSYVKRATNLSNAIKSCFFVFFILVTGNLFAQTINFPTSCTSGDLSLLSATLPAPAGDRCNCNGDRVLVLGIRNGTNSFRTSFALWGTLVRTTSSGTTTASIFACANGVKGKTQVPPNGDNFLIASTIEINGVAASVNNLNQPIVHISCGEAFEIINLHLAWTTSNDNETCDVLKNNPTTINPKCGVLPQISIGIGVQAARTITNATCTELGKIKVEPSGGLPNYQVCLDGGSCQNVAAGAFYQFTDVPVGTHTVTVTDNMSQPASARCAVTYNTTITQPDAVATPAATVDQPTCTTSTATVHVTSPVAGVTYTLTDGADATNSYTANGSGNFTSVIANKTYTVRATKGSCSATSSNVVVNAQPATPGTPTASVIQPTCTEATGSITVNSPDATVTYILTDPSPATTTHSNSTGVFSGLAAGTYGLKATKNGCTSGSVNKTVNAAPSHPSFTVCLVQPDLCTQYGSVTINATGGSGFTYKLNGGAPQGSNVFSNLASGSVTSITVINSDGCSATVSCSSLVQSCLPPGARISTPQQIESAVPTTTVKAYPNPFSDRIKFMVTSTVAGNGNLEVYNMMGQKIKTVYQGYIAKGTQTFELSLPKQNVGNLVYVLRIGDKKMTGKILQLNQ